MQVVSTERDTKVKCVLLLWYTSTDFVLVRAVDECRYGVGRAAIGCRGC
jgi:hypothetical protein